MYYYFPYPGYEGDYVILKRSRCIQTAATIALYLSSGLNYVKNIATDESMISRWW